MYMISFHYVSMQKIYSWRFGSCDENISKSLSKTTRGKAFKLSKFLGALTYTYSDFARNELSRSDPFMCSIELYFKGGCRAKGGITSLHMLCIHEITLNDLEMKKK